jgi:hypothetical protein
LSVVSADFKTKGGVFLPPKPTGRAWIKLRGEPALVMWETPYEAIKRWIEFQASDKPYVIFHDYAYGEMCLFTREAINQLAFIEITHPTAEQGRTSPTSIWAGLCPCAEFGGECPPLK